MVIISTRLLQYKKRIRICIIKKQWMYILKIFPFKNNHFGDQYTKLLKTNILQKQNYLQQMFQTNVEIIQMNLRTYQMKSKKLWKKWIQNRVCINKWLWSAEGSQRIKRKRKKPISITSKDNQKYQDVGLILIIISYKKISGHVNQISVKKCIKLNLGVLIQNI